MIYVNRRGDHQKKSAKSNVADAGITKEKQQQDRLKAKEEAKKQRESQTALKDKEEKLPIIKAFHIPAGLLNIEADIYAAGTLIAHTPATPISMDSIVLPAPLKAPLIVIAAPTNGAEIASFFKNDSEIFTTVSAPELIKIFATLSL